MRKVALLAAAALVAAFLFQAQSYLGQTSPANVLAYGADATGTNASDTAVSNALTASSHIYFPPGTYKLSSAVSKSITCGKSITVTGAGTNQTFINWPNANGGFSLSLSCVNTSFHFRDLTLETSQVNSGVGIQVSGAHAYGYAPQSDITNVDIHGDDFVPGVGPPTTHCFSIGININTVSNVTVTNTNTYGVWQNPGGAGCGIGLQYGGDSGSSTYATVLTLNSSSFNLHTVGIRLNNFWQGVTLDTVNINGSLGAVGLQQSGSASGSLAGLWIENSQFASYGDQIDLNTGVAGVLVTNNEFEATQAATTLLNLGSSTYITVVGNFFVNPSNLVNMTGVLMGGGGGNAVGVANIFEPMPSGIGWNLGYGGTPAVNVNISQNRYVGVTTHTANTGGAGTTIGAATD